MNQRARVSRLDAAPGVVVDGVPRLVVEASNYESVVDALAALLVDLVEEQMAGERVARDGQRGDG